MPTTFLLVLAAPSALGAPLSTEDQATIRAYLASEAPSNLKVCYITRTCARHLSSREFMVGLDFLLAPIQAGDWLVLIYAGLYQQLPGISRTSGLHASGYGSYRLAAPFRDTAWLDEEDLLLPILRHYEQARFKTLVILDAYAEGTELALQHPAWSSLEVVVLAGERSVGENECGCGSVIGPLFRYLSDIETSLMRRRKSLPSIARTYSAIKEQLEGEPDHQPASSGSESDHSSESSSSEAEKTHLRLYHSQAGETLLLDSFPL